MDSLLSIIKSVGQYRFHYLNFYCIAFGFFCLCWRHCLTFLGMLNCKLLIHYFGCSPFCFFFFFSFLQYHTHKNLLQRELKSSTLLKVRFKMSFALSFAAIAKAIRDEISQSFLIMCLKNMEYCLFNIQTLISIFSISFDCHFLVICFKLDSAFIKKNQGN